MKNTVLLFVFLLAYRINAHAQFPTVKWQYDIGAPSFGSAAAADLDKDGFDEIVFSTYTADGRVHCLNAEDGSERWVYNIGGCGDVAPLICDVDNDDTLDVIVNGSCNPTIFCINGYTGHLKWSKPSGGGDSPPTVTDIDHDGLPEILFCNFNGELRILNGEDGSTNRVVQVDPGYNPIETEPTLVDANNDSTPDVIMANYTNVNGLYIWAYNYVTNDTLWTDYLPDSASFAYYHGGAVADVDGDGKPEYVIGSNSGRVRALNTEDGSQLWSVMIPASDMAPVSIADLDHDGNPEVVVTNNDWITYDERIWVLDGATGNTEWSFPTTFSSFRGCAIADINGNDTLDLVAGFYMGDVIAVEPYTGLIWQMNLMSYFSPGLPWFDVDHGPLVADFDHNGKMDVFVVAGYGTYTPDSMNTGKAFMIEAGNGHCPEWLMFRQDVYRSGYLSPQDESASCSAVQGIPADAKDPFAFSVTPDPAEDETRISLPGHFSVEVYDLSGRRMYIRMQNQDACTLDVSGWTPGMYIVKVRQDGKEADRKLVVE